MVPRKQSDDTKSGSFWTTLPGILTGIAAVVTAVAGIIGALTNFIGLHDRPSTTTQAPNSGPAHPTAEGSGAGINSTQNKSESAVASSKVTYPRDLNIKASATAGDYTFEILSARVEEFGQDPATQVKTLLLRLRIRETFHAKDRGTGYFMPDGFRLVIDDVARAPKEAPIQNVVRGASEDGEVTFLLPENAKQVSLLVGYYDNQRSKIPLALFPPRGG